MKKITLLSFILILLNLGSNAQCTNSYYCVQFDDTSCQYHLKIDTAGNPNNIWQITKAPKLLLGNSSCSTKVIVTDSVNAYPVLNRSSFTITNLAMMEDVYGIRTLSAAYFVQTDSLKDSCMIELSLDKGLTWYDIINDTTYKNHFVWWGGKPVLTGHSGICRNLSVNLADLKTIQNFSVGDTMLFRFSFISDGNFDNLGGLQFDNICFSSFVEGISDIHFKAIGSTIYPNPSSDIFNIEFDNPGAEAFQLAVYDIHSKPMFKREGIRENKILINAHQLKPGDYIYKITNEVLKKRCWGKFTVTK